jgi:hypothetical protein
MQHIGQRPYLCAKLANYSLRATVFKFVFVFLFDYKYIPECFIKPEA